MPKITNKQLAQVFTNAKKRLAKDWRDYQCPGYQGPKFICHAIEDVANTMEEQEAAKKIISDRLDGCCSLEDWLEKVHGVNNQRLGHGILTLGEYSHRPMYWQPLKDYHDRMQITRHAWLDSLIEEFNA